MRLLSLAAVLTASTAFPETAVAQTNSRTPASAQENGGQPDWLEQARILAQMEGTSVGEQVRRYRLHQKAIMLD
jgi:hypothetical protein